MRIGHIIGGQIVFAIGLFLLYLNSAIVAGFMKGLAQPILLLLGIFFVVAAIFGKEVFRKINAVVGVLFMGVGAYGLYDEWYPTLDFITGGSPIFFIVAGVILLACGVARTGKMSGK